MAYIINKNCVSCGSCITECPVEAIIENEDQYIIEYEKCTSCGICVNTCPVEAIILNE